MRRSFLLFILACSLGASVSFTYAEEASAKTARIEALIAQLGSERYAEREEAARALDAAGPIALAGLRKALDSDDAEVRRRAEELIAAIERRQEAARLLEPKRVRLVYDDVLVTEAVADFARKTGYPIQVPDDQARLLAGRRISLNTGETTYWDALAKLCDRAGIRERETRTEPQPAPRQQVIGRGGARRVMFLDDASSLALARPEGPLTLEDGKGPRLPVCEAGALRIRALPPQAISADPGRGDREVTFAADVRPEPRIGWEGLVALRVVKAVDDQGQTLRQPGAALGGPNSLLGQTEEVIMLWDGHSTLPLGPGPRQIPVRLLLADRPSRHLKEVSGVVAVRIRTPPEAQATVADILKAGGKTFDGADGSTLKVIEAGLESDGLYKVQVAVTPPPPSADVENLGLRVVRINRDVPGKMTVSAKDGNCPLSLLDAKGQPFRLTTGDYLPDAGGPMKTYTLIFQPGKDQGEPAKLVYTERRSVIVEVPFTLKDVPLVKDGAGK
jgi:hypothetical protein